MLVSDQRSVVIIENSAGDRRLIAEAFRDLEPGFSLKFLTHEEFAVSMGKQPPELPALIIVGFSPRGDSLKLLEQLKSHTLLKSIPVFVMMETVNETVARALHARQIDFTIKPVSYLSWVEVLRRILSIALLPTEPD